MDFWERASSRMVKATIFSRILLRNYNLFLATAVVFESGVEKGFNYISIQYEVGRLIKTKVRLKYTVVD